MDFAKARTLDGVVSRVEMAMIASRTFPTDRTAPRAVSAWLRALSTGLSASRLADAELCLDELVTNVVRHAHADGGGHVLAVSAARDGAEVAFTLEDDGLPFDPTAAPEPAVPRTLDEAVPGGRGLLLVRSIAPRLTYERRGSLNRTTVAFPVETRA